MLNLVPVFEYGAATGTWDYDGDWLHQHDRPSAGR